MVRTGDFTTTFRRGARAVSPRIVVHAQADKLLNESVLVGFVVPKKQIAKATARNLVKRRLRNLLRNQVSEVPPGTRIVIRAKSAAATADYHQLQADVAKCLPKAVARAQALAQTRECETPSEISGEKA